MNVDISALDAYFQAFAIPVITALGGIVAYKIDQHFKLSNDSIAATRVATGVNAMAQAAIGELASIEAHNQTIDVKNAAVAKAIGNASAGFIKAAAAVGLTPDVLANRVTGAIAEKLTPTPAPLAVIAAPIIAKPAA